MRPRIPFFTKEGGGMASDIGMINDHLVQDLNFEDGLYVAFA